MLPVLRLQLGRLLKARRLEHFRPAHANNLANDFAAYANYPTLTLWHTVCYGNFGRRLVLPVACDRFSLRNIIIAEHYFNRESSAVERRMKRVWKRFVLACLAPSVKKTDGKGLPFLKWMITLSRQPSLLSCVSSQQTTKEKNEQKYFIRVVYEHLMQTRKWKTRWDRISRIMSRKYYNWHAKRRERHLWIDQKSAR